MTGTPTSTSDEDVADRLHTYGIVTNLFGAAVARPAYMLREQTRWRRQRDDGVHRDREVTHSPRTIVCMPEPAG